MTYVRAFSFESELLADNFIGDPHVRDLPVYLPPGYTERAREPYPVVYVLAGWSGRGAHYLRDMGAFAPNLVQQLDTMIEEKRMRPCIVVFPDCSSKLGCSQYVNSSVNGPYMDYLADEIVDWVDRRFHTHRSREYRGLVGHSSGGMGALVTGMLRSDRFANLCSSAGDAWYEFLYTHQIAQVIREIDRAGGVESFVERFLSSPNPRALLGLGATHAMLYLSMCSCYTPNPNVPAIYGDLWFDLHTGALIEEPWKRMLQWDPLRMIDQHVTALRSLRWIHLEAGAQDEYGLQLGHRQIAAKLDGLGIPYAFDEYPGGHGGHEHRHADRIRRMVDRMHEQ